MWMTDVSYTYKPNKNQLIYRNERNDVGRKQHRDCTTSGWVGDAVSDDINFAVLGLNLRAG